MVKGVEFVSLQERIDTDSAMGKFTFQIFGAVAEFEGDLIRERTQAGLKSARARGRVGGKPRKMDDRAIKKAKELLSKGNMCVAPPLVREVAEGRRVQ